MFAYSESGNCVAGSGGSRAEMLLASLNEDKKKEQSVTEKNINDDVLVRRSQDGDRHAYQVLVERYQGRAFRIAFNILRSKEDAEDVIQESFVKAYLSLSKFQGKSKFYTWFYRIVYNMSIDVKRKLSRQGGVPVEFDEGVLNSSSNASSLLAKVESPAGALTRKEQAKRIQAALNELSEEHRIAITLREFDGASYDEIARITGVSKGTVMSRPHYARKNLQEALRDLVSDEAEEQFFEVNGEMKSEGIKDGLG